VIAEENTDSSGEALLFIEDEELRQHGDRLSMTVGGEPVELLAALRERERKEAREQDAERERAERATAQKAIDNVRQALDDEVKTGTCQAVTIAQLEKALAFLNMQLKGLVRGSDPRFVSIVDHDFVVATPSGSRHTFHVGLGGEYHIIAIAFQPIEMAVQDGRGNPVEAVPSLIGLAQFIGPADARTVHTRPMDDISVNLVGRGCSLLVILNE
jgi:hypothetical protein